MKSYNHLWEQFISYDNIDLAITNAAKHKHKRRDVIKVERNRPYYIRKIQKELISGYKNNKHTPISIYDGIQRKKREIIVPSYREQIVHHALINILKPIFSKGMYEHSYGSLPNKGGFKGKHTIEKWIKSDTQNTKYFLKMDIRHYFQSIPHTIILNKLSKLIRDKKLLAVLTETISVIDEGIPLGFYTSQWLANWYLTELDHYIKEILHVKYYIRYMDDLVIFSDNKTDLHNFRQSISDYLMNKLGLSLKSNWFIAPLLANDNKGKALDFMGFKFCRESTGLRKSILLKATRKARKIAKRGLTMYSCKQMAAYYGWFKQTHTKDYYGRVIRPFINFHTLFMYISQHDKKLRRRVINVETG